MCNAWNHPSYCTCGFGGSGSGGLRTYNLYTPDTRLVGDAQFKYHGRYDLLQTEGAKTYPTNCWWCYEPVFYHTNGYGDSVLFDSLGHPWQVHPCWTEHWEKEKERRKNFEASNKTRVYMAPLEEPLILRKPEEIVFNQLKKLLFQGAVQSIKSRGIILNEKNLATQMGISGEQLQLEYGMFFIQVVIQSIRSTGITPDERNVATQMGISLAELRIDYGKYYHTS